MDQIKKILEGFKKMLNGQNKKKLVENTIIIIIIGIILLIAGNTLFGKSGKNEDENSESGSTIEAAASNTSADDSGDIEKRLAEILSQIEGVGKASVMITYVSGKEPVPAYDIKRNESETDEKDTSGGTRSIKQSDYESSIVFEEAQSGTKKPFILKDLQPEVKGVIVVADGASDPEVKEKISKAVQVAMDIPIHKVQVFEKGK